MQKARLMDHTSPVFFPLPHLQSPLILKLANSNYNMLVLWNECGRHYRGCFIIENIVLSYSVMQRETHWCLTIPCWFMPGTEQQAFLIWSWIRVRTPSCKNPHRCHSKFTCWVEFLLKAAFMLLWCVMHKHCSIKNMSIALRPNWNMVIKAMIWRIFFTTAVDIYYNGDW